ncbi:MAG: alanine--glyoxylate aminotransferase family protein [Phycisphaeraceae bacterium]
MPAPLTFKQRVMTPGPTDVPPEVLLEMAQPIIHHRTKAFQAIFQELSESLQRLFRTTGPVLSIAGSGTTAFEAAQISLMPPGGKALTIAGGKFGERWQDIYDTYGIEQIKLDVPWGEAADPAKVEQILKDNPDIQIVTLVHSETSTATASDAKKIAEIVSKTDALLLLDAITAVGALPVDQDAWGIDVLVTGSQKAMMLPPGLGFVGLGQRAIKRLEETKGLPAYNLDLRRWLKSYKSNDVPFTPPVSLIRGQRVALQIVEKVGLENVWLRTAALAKATRAAFEAMGLTLVSKSPSDSVSGAYYPEGIEDGAFRKAMRETHGIHMAGGQDGRGAKWKGKIFRLNHMGYVDAGDTLAALQAIEAEFVAAGAVKTPAGTALAAAGKVMAEA